MGTKRIGWARIRSLINENTNQIKIKKQEIVHVNKIVLVVGSNHVQNIAAHSGDKFYGKVVVVRAAAAADDKNCCQTVAKASGQDNLKLRDRGATLGGNTGDVIELWCLDDGFWTVEARLSLTAGNPSGTTVIDD